MAVVRVATLNLLHGRSITDGDVREGDLAAAAGELDADVLALQEVDRGQARSAGTDQTATVAAALGAPSWRFAPTLRGVPGQVWSPALDGRGFARASDLDAEPAFDGPAYGIGLVTRWEARSWHVLRFPAAPVGLPLLVVGRGLQRVPDEPRAVLAAVVSGPTGPFTVASAHLSFVPGVNVAQLRRAARWLAGFPGPRLLLGDLNLPGRLPELVSRWRQLGRVATYPSWRPRVQWDHVLGTGIDPARVCGVEARRLPVSDHCGLAVSLDL